MEYWVGIAVSVFMNLVKDRRNRGRFLTQVAKVFVALDAWRVADNELRKEIERVQEPVSWK